MALLIADKNTGHILDSKYQQVVNDDQQAYTVFDSIEDAKEHADTVTKINDSIEVAIYSHSHEVIYYSNE